MRVAIVADIHGNFDAFQQVLIDVEKSRIDSIISLGDNIGYGPEPDRVIQEIQSREIPSIIGNHELAVNDPDYLSWFNPVARRSLIKTRDMLSELSTRFISELEPYRVDHQCRFVHGFPPDSSLIYFFQVSDTLKKKALDDIPERLCFVGHTHALEIVEYNGDDLKYSDLSEGLVPLEADKQYIINIGSVGQPRDGNNKSKYAIWDSSKSTVEVKFILYDIAAVVKKIKAAGLPENHAKRLW